MNPQTHGIHHITAIAGNAQQNVAFYSHILGLRLVKLTVNYDDPTAYHLYYGDRIGTPGSILTFFIWPDLPEGKIGTGQVTGFSFKVPKGSLEYWEKRLQEFEVEYLGIAPEFDEDQIAMDDPDGLLIRLIETDDGSEFHYWDGANIPKEYAIKGFHGVQISVKKPDDTAALLTETLGFAQGVKHSNVTRYVNNGQSVFLQSNSPLPEGEVGVGTVHHVAWRVETEKEELEVRELVKERGLLPTHEIDRTYFKSVYFREPGNVLFELATDQPGFLIDEKEEELGTKLILPKDLEKHRSKIESEHPDLISLSKKKK